MRQDRNFDYMGLEFDEGYIHEIEPIGPIGRRDLKWIGVLQGRHPANGRGRNNEYPEVSDDDVADNYWSGKATANPDWEWVSREANVITVDNHLSQVRKNTPFLDFFTRFLRE